MEIQKVFISFIDKNVLRFDYFQYNGLSKISQLISIK